MMGAWRRPSKWPSVNNEQRGTGLGVGTVRLGIVSDLAAHVRRQGEPTDTEDVSRISALDAPACSSY